MNNIESDGMIANKQQLQRCPQQREMFAHLNSIELSMQLKCNRAYYGKPK